MALAMETIVVEVQPRRGGILNRGILAVEGMSLLYLLIVVILILILLGYFAR